MNWIWNYCESRQELTHFDYMTLVQQPLRALVKVKDNKYYYTDNEKGVSWSPCTSGHIKYLIATCLLAIRDQLVSKAKTCDLVLPRSWSRPRVCVISDSSLTKILRLCKEGFQDDFIAISHTPPHPSTSNAIPFTYHIQEVYL